MNEKPTFYDGTKLLSMRDLNNERPEIYMCTSNRSAGKTTWFNRYFVKKFLETHEKFMLFYRFKYEISDCADKFFKDIHGLFFPDCDMYSKPRNGVYHELFLNDYPCGYAVSLNSADQLKKYSHLFSDTQRILFDEFQSENNTYVSDEIKKFISIHTSVARGNGSQSRYLPVYMLSNNVSVLNPYFAELGVSARLTSETNFLRGNGWVLEQGFNEGASKAQLESKFMQAFSKNDYIGYLTSKDYLYNDNAFIEKMSGVSRYLCTFRHQGKLYSIREFPNDKVLYVDNSIDETFKLKIAVDVEDMLPEYQLRMPNDIFIQAFRRYFNSGCFRFKNMECKASLICLLKY